MRYRLLLFLLLVYLPVWAQDETETRLEQAEMLADEAGWFIEHGDSKEGVRLLNEARKLDPYSIDYNIDIAIAHFVAREYPKAIAEAEKLLGRTDATDLVVQIISASYRLQHKDIKAKAVLDKGFERFRDSPRLHLELGLLQLYWGQFDQSLHSFERGIKAGPKYSPNYFFASLVCLKAPQQEKMWGLFYGEMFLNLHCSFQPAIVYMSKLLYDTYKSQITFPAPNRCRVDFALPPDPEKTASWHRNHPPKPTYCTAVFQPTLANAVGTEQDITLPALVRIRSNFLDFYYMQDYHLKYPNLLFEFQKRVEEAGHKQAYHYWLLSEGDKKTFTDWRDRNYDRWSAFAEWFQGHRLDPVLGRVLTRSK